MSLQSNEGFGEPIPRLLNRFESNRSHPSATYGRKTSGLIDAKLRAAGWIVLDREQMYVVVALGVAVREYTNADQPCDYQLFVDRKACGIVVCNQEGGIFFDVADQSSYREHRFLANPPEWSNPHRFNYEIFNSGIVFNDQADAKQHLRHLVGFHRPDALHRWMQDN
jgi:type I restriction enzyme, R subunit